MPIIIRELVVKVKINEPAPERLGKQEAAKGTYPEAREHALVIEAVEQTLKILRNKKER